MSLEPGLDKVDSDGNTALIAAHKPDEVILTGESDAGSAASQPSGAEAGPSTGAAGAQRGRGGGRGRGRGGRTWCAGSPAPAHEANRMVGGRFSTSL